MNQEMVIEASGKNVEEAISSALAQLSAERDRVEIEIINEGTKGLLGLIGKHDAMVRVTLKLSPEEKVCSFLNEIFINMGADIYSKAEDGEESLKIVLEGNDVASAIGHRGEVLDALQYLASLVYNKDKSEYKRLILDSEDFRSKREETLRKLAERLAEKVKKYRREVVLEPMNPYERRIIHSVLQSNRYVRTYSIGEEPSRKVVICCK